MNKNLCSGATHAITLLHNIIITITKRMEKNHNNNNEFDKLLLQNVIYYDIKIQGVSYDDCDYLTLYDASFLIIFHANI